LDRDGPSLLLRVELCRVDRDVVDANGFFQRTDRCIVALRFVDVRDLFIQDFNHQNVLAGIVLEYDGDLRVTIDGVFGVSATFCCAQAIVEDLTLCE
jgi:hypothetical protein